MSDFYVGRYAPSPSGDLHLGNLRTALVAWLHARLNGGRFLLRMEDIDAPRMVKGSADQILEDLEWLGIDWDGDVVFQSKRHDLYSSALSRLDELGLIYECFCSRKDIRDASSAPHGRSGVYSGVCANLSHTERVEKRKLKNSAIRVRCDAKLASGYGDFVVKRADDLFAYQLAVVVDDLDQGVTNVVRGADLEDSTLRQLYLAKTLQPTQECAVYQHVPLLMDADGNRMSKRDGSFSAKEWRASGQSVGSLVGQFSVQLGFIDTDSSLTAYELLAELKSSDVESIFACGQ